MEEVRGGLVKLACIMADGRRKPIGRKAGRLARKARRLAHKARRLARKAGRLARNPCCTNGSGSAIILIARALVAPLF